MFLWFIGTSVATIWFVFHDKKFAYRLVVAGALAPDAIEVFLGHAGPLHSVVTMVAIMAAVMLITYGRKKSRSKMLAVVIGMFLHLVFDGAFANTEMFWWPLWGFEFGDYALPVFDRGLWNIPLELIGAALLYWTYTNVKDTNA
ncbi:MAG: hypothetical protein O3A24_02720 [Actinobacteria bacterium]|jgi:membrane-bound metal-dependent hydrolase YbcI (DUF457 family)|nr:hypothetical protein [Actinomycetota bacterium]